ncbi:MAG: hypothetical protein ACK48F_03545 [Chryseotalea sp.]|jgi:hypothetical protein
MTREQHLEFCTRCLNRKFDPNYGTVCGLTGKIASFEKECPDFKVDESVKIKIDNETSLSINEVKSKLSSDVYERIRLEQNLLGAVLSGILVSVICAILWGVFTVATEFQISYMAILVGAGVGYTMLKVGKGVDQIFGFFGAGISLFGCLLGNFLSIIGFIAIANDLGYFETLFLFDYSQTLSVMQETFDVRDLIFYSIAIVTGYKLAMRSITEQDISDLNKNAR